MKGAEQKDDDQLFYHETRRHNTVTYKKVKIVLFFTIQSNNRFPSEQSYPTLITRNNSFVSLERNSD